MQATTQFPNLPFPKFISFQSILYNLWILLNAHIAFQINKSFVRFLFCFATKILNFVVFFCPLTAQAKYCTQSNTEPVECQFLFGLCWILLLILKMTLFSECLLLDWKVIFWPRKQKWISTNKYIMWCITFLFFLPSAAVVAHLFTTPFFCFQNIFYWLIWQINTFFFTTKKVFLRILSFLLFLFVSPPFF